jgi:hypothetical protein
MPNERRYVMFASDEPKPMGDTLLDYARPLIATLPPDHTFDELKATVVFAALVWNIGIFDEVHDAVVYLERKMPPRLRLRAPVGATVIRRMLSRKELLFRGDDRAALAVDVYRDETRLRVKALGIVGAPDAPSPTDAREVAKPTSLRRWVH